VRCDTSDSSRRYGRVAQRARCGFSGETLSGRAFAGPPPCLGSLIWNDQTTFAQAKPETPAKAPSRPRKLVQRFPRFSDPIFGACHHTVTGMPEQALQTAHDIVTDQVKNRNQSERDDGGKNNAEG